MVKLKWKPEGIGATDVVHMGQIPRTGSVLGKDGKEQTSDASAHSIDLESLVYLLLPQLH